ncbi:carbohydrate sulfotransferase 12-like [Brachyhypopomus gauderio]|uniref:carbohydrate sulfotransferase 12-like n=1 Tax=Brachyhypopomus gauderio TaxID=698409 RepID=UPI004040EFFF
MMKTSRCSYLLFLLMSFSALLAFLWYSDIKDRFAFRFQYGTSLEGCLYNGQLQARFPSTHGQKCSGYGGISNTSGGPAGSDEVGAIYSAVPLYLEHRQYARKKLINDLCNNNGTIRFLKEKTLDDIPSDLLSNLVVDDRHGIIYCYVPKVACTQWKRVMIVLSESLKVNGTPYKNLSDIPTEIVHGDSLIYLKSHRDMKQKLRKYKKFTFVRNPFVRLISAYREKFNKPNKYFYKTFAVPILVKYGHMSPPASEEEAHAAGIHPSFPDFIHYLLDLPDDNAHAFQEHWRQTYHLCHPCQIKYDFVGKMETMQEDARHLLRVLEVDHMVSFPSGTSNRTEESWINTWFTSIPDELKRKLYKTYEADFKLFGYSLPENFFLNADPSQSTSQVRIND